MRKIFLIIFPIILIGLIYLIITNNIFSKKDEAINKDGENMNKTIKINMIINEEVFTATLEDNETVSEFIKMLPMEIEMKDLNNNEKYYYLSSNLPTNSYSPKNIYEGDIMLFGSDCFVIFYEEFKTSYSYTRIGKVDDFEKFSVEFLKNKANTKLKLELNS